MEATIGDDPLVAIESRVPFRIPVAVLSLEAVQIDVPGDGKKPAYRVMLEAVVPPQMAALILGRTKDHKLLLQTVEVEE